MDTIASQITSLTIVYTTVYSDADQSKHQSSASLAFVWGIHRDRWIPRTKGQLRGKCFHLMTSSCIGTGVCGSWSRGMNTSYLTNVDSFVMLFFSLLSIHTDPLQWRHNERDGVLNRQPQHCLLNRLFRHRSKKTYKHRVTGLCPRNWPVTGEFPSQRPVTQSFNVFFDPRLNKRLSKPSRRRWFE